MRDKKKEEELRGSDDPTHLHLKDDLHVLVQSEPPYSNSKLAAGVAEVKKMLIPLVKHASSTCVCMLFSRQQMLVCYGCDDDKTILLTDSLCGFRTWKLYSSL